LNTKVIIFEWKVCLWNIALDEKLEIFFGI
jgi:hypothetical protein